MEPMNIVRAAQCITELGTQATVEIPFWQGPSEAGPLATHTPYPPQTALRFLPQHTPPQPGQRADRVLQDSKEPLRLQLSQKPPTLKARLGWSCPKLLCSLAPEAAGLIPLVPAATAEA